MADVEQCRVAIRGLSDRMVASGTRLPERTVSCTLTDLGVVLLAHLTETGLSDITEVDLGSQPVPAPAQVRLSLSSDDLVALVERTLDPTQAYLAGRLKVGASFGDLLLLRSMG